MELQGSIILKEYYENGGSQHFAIEIDKSVTLILDYFKNI